MAERSVSKEHKGWEMQGHNWEIQSTLSPSTFLMSAERYLNKGRAQARVVTRADHLCLLC